LRGSGLGSRGQGDGAGHARAENAPTRRKTLPYHYTLVHRPPPRFTPRHYRGTSLSINDALLELFLGTYGASKRGAVSDERGTSVCALAGPFACPRGVNIKGRKERIRCWRSAG